MGKKSDIVFQWVSFHSFLCYRCVWTKYMACWQITQYLALYLFMDQFVRGINDHSLGGKRWSLAGGRQATPTALSTLVTPPWQQQCGRPEPCAILKINCSIKLLFTFEHITQIKVRVLLSGVVLGDEVADPHWLWSGRLTWKMMSDEWRKIHWHGLGLVWVGHSFTQHMVSLYS